MSLWTNKIAWRGTAVALLALGCAPAARPAGGLAGGLADSAFASLVQELSEAGQYFDTDNLISNEGTYLDVATGLARHGVRGGAYLGVGPDQNFSYIARIRPRIAFIIDIRRDNLLQHLWFKALFAGAETRAEYLAHLYGRRLDDPGRWRNAPVTELVAAIAEAPVDSTAAEAVIAGTVAAAAELGVPLSATDRATIEGIHRRFVAAGPGLRFTTHGRAPRPCYPSHGDLLTATDLDGAPASYLASEADYRFLRDLQARNLIVPVVGDLAGTRALAGIADFLRRRAVPASAFYVSNVEFYLARGGAFERYAQNLEALPGRPVVIRSVFQGPAAWGAAASGRGTCSAQSLQAAATVVDAVAGGATLGYSELVSRDTLPLRP